MTLQADAAQPTAPRADVTPPPAPAASGIPGVTVVVPRPRADAPAPWMPAPRPPAPMAPAPFDALAGHPAGRSSYPAAPPAGLTHPVPPVAAPPAGPSAGRVVGMVAAVVGAVVVLLVVGGIALTLLFSASAPPADTAPSTPAVSAPAQPAAPARPAVPAGPAQADRATAQAFNAAGKRLDGAKKAFDDAVTTASRSGDRAAFAAAADDFAAELRVYRAAVTGLTLPAAEQQAVTDRLLPLVDATIADCEAMSSADGKQELVDAAGRFDADWKAAANAHNEVNTALPAI